MREAVRQYFLLNHPYYQAWECGQISRASLQTYAQEYYHHVAAFPRYLSALHSQMKSLQDRQTILENLIDEEQGENNHPELWLRFCEGLGVSRQTILESEPGEASQRVIDTFFAAAFHSEAAGLGALYAYESQIPEIAKFKVEALRKHYLSPENTKALEFFKVHESADVYHTQAVEKLIADLPEDKKEICKRSAMATADVLWKFLDSMPA